MPTLYIYETCPYCTRTTMVNAYKGLGDKTEIKYFDYGDVDGPTALIGKKMVPIYTNDNGESMGESLDIVDVLDKLGDDNKIITPKTDLADKYEQWYRGLFRDVLIAQYHLIEHIDVPDFATKDAVAFHHNKFSKIIGLNDDEIAALVPDSLKKMQDAITQLDGIIKLPSENNQQLSYDDLYMWPFLRNFTIHKEIVYPPRVQQYLDEISKMTGLRLFPNCQ